MKTKLCNWIYSAAVALGLAVMLVIPVITPREWHAVLCGVAIAGVEGAIVALAWWLTRNRRSE